MPPENKRRQRAKELAGKLRRIMEQTSMPRDAISDPDESVRVIVRPSSDERRPAVRGPYRPFDEEDE